MGHKITPSPPGPSFKARLRRNTKSAGTEQGVVWKHPADSFPKNVSFGCSTTLGAE